MRQALTKQEGYDNLDRSPQLCKVICHAYHNNQPKCLLVILKKVTLLTFLQPHPLQPHFLTNQNGMTVDGQKAIQITGLEHKKAWLSEKQPFLFNIFNRFLYFLNVLSTHTSFILMLQSLSKDY